MRELELSQLPQLKPIAVAATVSITSTSVTARRAASQSATRAFTLNISLPEHVQLLMLALRRNLVAFTQDVRSGRWQQAKQFCLLDHPIGDLYGSTIGIIGYGFLGNGVAKLARSIDMQVLVPNARTQQRVKDVQSLVRSCG